MSCEEILFIILFHMSIIPTFSSPLSNYYYEHHSPLKTNFVSTNKEIDHPILPPRYLKVPTFVQTYEGADVILSCNVENLADRMVFWIRNSDLQILTAGLLTFSSDSRFRVNHENSVDENDWSLLITNVKTQDSGAYECQINTDPKMKLNINLLVKESDEMMEMDSPHRGASIEGENSKVLKRGHTVTLTCRVFGIMNDNVSKNEIEWMKNGKPLLTARNIFTSINTVFTTGGDGISRLTLAMLKDDDEGSYSCSLNGFLSEPVQLRVVAEHLEEEEDKIKYQNSARGLVVCKHLLIVQILILKLALLLNFV